MSQQKLSKAFDLMKQGRKSEAIAIVRGVLQDDMENVNAWLLMANLLDDEAKKSKALERILKLRPDHPGALKMMAQLQPDEPVAEKKKRDQYDWSKLDAKQKRVAQPSLLRHIIGVIVTVFFALSFMWFTPLSAFVTQSIPVGEVTGPPPEQVLITQLTAAFNRNRQVVQDLTCDSLEDEWLKQIDVLEAEMHRLGITTLTYDLSGLSIEVLEQSPRYRRVRIVGDLVVTQDGHTVTIDFLDAIKAGGGYINEARLIVSDGRWIVCSF